MFTASFLRQLRGKLSQRSSVGVTYKYKLLSGVMDSALLRDDTWRGTNRDRKLDIDESLVSDMYLVGRW